MLKFFLLILLLWVRHGLAAEVGHRAIDEDFEACFKLKDRTAANACYLRRAEAGHAGAQWLLGSNFEQGQYTAKDDAQSVYWYRKAAEQGYELAQLDLGRKLFRGNGVAKNVTEGLRWLTKAAEEGSRDAQMELGNIYDRGDGVVKDKALAIKFFTMLTDKSNKHDGEAAYAIGRIFEAGEGIARDESEAIAWYKKSADRQDFRGAFALGKLLVKRKATPKDVEDGMHWIRVAARSNNEDAKAYLDVYDKGWQEKERYLAVQSRLRPVDLSIPSERLLDAVVLVGIDSKAEWTKSGWGSGILVSKCHVLTSNHVVFRHDKKTRDLVDGEPMVIGKEVAVGLGQIDTPPWKKEIVVGKVVGFDSNIIMRNSDGSGTYSVAQDWALVRLPKSSAGTYPGQSIQPMCMSPRGRPLRYKDIKDSAVRSVGHPGSEYMRTKRISLQQDTQCVISGVMGAVWTTSCQTLPGMSGGAVVTMSTDENGSKCWMPLGLISAGDLATGGFTREDERHPSLTNMLASVNFRERKLIDAAMDAYPCDPEVSSTQSAPSRKSTNSVSGPIDSGG